MQKCDDNAELRAKTIAHWAGFSYPGNERDIARVYAFRELDPATATNDDVTRAYGGDGWATSAACQECGSHTNPRVEIGGAVICTSCMAKAIALHQPTEPEAKPGIIARLFG